MKGKQRSPNYVIARKKGLKAFRSLGLVEKFVNHFLHVFKRSQDRCLEVWCARHREIGDPNSEV